MSSQPPRPTSRVSARPPEPEDSYPHIPEPRQNHTGSLLAFVSVLAVLGFGFWTAVATITKSDEPNAKPTPTAMATRPAAPATTAAPVSSTPAPAGTPVASSTAVPGSGKVHVVGQGDTLTKIAQKYGTTVDAIMAANGITDRGKVLHIGDRLTLP